MKNKDSNSGLSERQNHILKVIVEEYINCASPVGSKKIQELLGVDVSTATIRNESMFLEEVGLLEKSHSSSGRIPSTAGYRYYVDTLMGKNKIKEAKQKIDELFSKREESIESLLNQASTVISEMTNLVTVVSTRNINKDIALSKIELIPISNESAAMIIVLSSGEVQNKLIEFGDDTSLEEFQIAIKIFNERLINTPLSDIEQKIDLITPIIKEQVVRYEFILKTFVNTVMHEEVMNQKTQGMKYLLTNPEFDDPGMIKQIVSIIENTSLLTWFEKSSQDESKPFFKIGEETGLSNNIAMVGKNLKIQHGKEASLAVVGPKRIHYQLVSEMLEWFSFKIQEKCKNQKGEE